MKTDEYDNLFSKDIETDKIPILYDISTLTYEMHENPNQTFLDKDALGKLETRSIQLIGEENYTNIMSYYFKLVNEVPELTDEHSTKLNDYINETLKDQKKEIYLKVKIIILFNF
jgi:ABC-type phosphate transport system substrate-binding protein